MSWRLPLLLAWLCLGCAFLPQCSAPPPMKPVKQQLALCTKDMHTFNNRFCAAELKRRTTGYARSRVAEKTLILDALAAEARHTRDLERWSQRTSINEAIRLTQKLMPLFFTTIGWLCLMLAAYLGWKSR